MKTSLLMIWMQYLMMKEVNHHKQITFTTFMITSKIIATVHLLVPNYGKGLFFVHIQQ